jgi:chromosome segregation ATPase
MEKKQLTSEELQSLKDLQNDYAKLMTELGTYDLQISDLEDSKKILQEQKQKVKDSVKELREKENVIAKELNDKYGQGVIDINTGEISIN